MNIEQPILSKAIILAMSIIMRIECHRVVDICQRNRLPILGIDSLIVTETKTQPFMEHSIDLSDSQKLLQGC